MVAEPQPPRPTRPPFKVCSLDDRGERLPLLYDICRELRSVALDRMYCFGRDHQRLAGRDCPRTRSFDLVFQLPFEDVDDLLPGMKVLEGGRFRGDLDAVLDDLTAGDA